LRALTPQASASANSATRTSGFPAKDSNLVDDTAKGLNAQHL
jgi:hypothetical protein